DTNSRAVTDMTMSAPPRSDKPGAAASDRDTGYEPEIIAAAKSLQADPADLRHLLRFIETKQVTREQVPDLLRQGHARLGALRQEGADLADIAARVPPAAAPIEQAAQALQSGAALSVDHAFEAYEQAFQRCVQGQGSREDRDNSKTSGTARPPMSGYAALTRPTSAPREGSRMALSRPSARGISPSSLQGGIHGVSQQGHARTEQPPQPDEAALTRPTEAPGVARPIDRARIRASQAQIAAIRLEHRRAAELFAEAAAMAGLDAPTQWRYQTERALILEALGRDLVDSPAIEEAIDLYENKILALVPRDTRPDDWATTQNHLGTALGLLGRRQSGTALLERSVAAFEQALAAYHRERAPLEWAAAQNNLGNALGILGQRRHDIEMLERAAAAFEQALEERTRERAPRDWAMTQNNLGAVLQALGQRKKEPASLQRAIDAYKAALEEWTRARAPQDWATTLDNIGTALRLLGEHGEDPRALEQSVAAYRNALTERTRERAPQDWAMTQNNLGAALHKLGERQDTPAAVAQAIEAYEKALEEWTRERMPFVWAMTKANLGAARKLLARHTRDADIARLAVADFDAVRDFFRHASHAQYYELAEEQLAQALTLLDELLDG
ncbi:tetratricopeptide repeat protein, partial [Thioalkalicoccus limnaeus]